MKYINTIVAIAKRVDMNYAINLVYSLGVMGQDYPDELAKHREYVESKKRRLAHDFNIPYEIENKQMR